MNVNRKFDRFKQWAGERMGGEIKTNLSDDFKAMETEMSVRNEGESTGANSGRSIADFFFSLRS
jgi:hypothetical protein